MIKAWKIGCIAAVMTAAAGTAAHAKGTFLCMTPEDPVAITVDQYKYYRYMEMTSSNGAVATAQVSTDGNTYLPLRFICEAAGLTDCAGVSGYMPDNSFRYMPADANGPDRIELMVNGQYYCHNVGEQFTYEAAPGDIRNVAVYNVRGSLYMPMTYIAKITGALAIWYPETGQVMFISSGLDSTEYVMPDGRIRRDKEMILGFDFFANNLCDSPLYLRTDGMTVGNIEDEAGAGAHSPTRISTLIYYIDAEGYISATYQDSYETERISLTDENGAPVDIKASTLAAVRGKLYGIVAGENGGRLFCFDSDGTNFRYLTDKNVYNMQVTKDSVYHYMFYGEADSHSVIHMIDMRTMDDYTMELTDYSHVNLLNDMKQFVVGETYMSYIDSGGGLHVINMDQNPKEIEIIRVLPENHRIYTYDSNGNPIGKILYINYDYVNDLIYAVAEDSSIYYFEKSTEQFVKFDTYSGMSTFSLFCDKGFNDCCSGIQNGSIFLRHTIYSGSRVWYLD